MQRGEAQWRWAQALADWAIPDAILERAPESPWGFPPSLFRANHADEELADSPSTLRALEALPQRGAVLDVGVGGGAGSFPLAAKAACITGVDQSETMLESFSAAAAAAGVEQHAVVGEWPQVAAEAGTADVVICHHVFYNVSDLVPFAGALTSAARRRVVVEMTATHPASMLNELWLHFHGLERPTGPNYEDALSVLRELDLDVEVERWKRLPRRMHADRRDHVAFVRRRLCLTEDRDAEIDELMGATPVWSPTEVATLWWSGKA
ncbi:hypothetical protein BH24ACT26_BH24ACT26_16800 [soil metagenome]